MNPQESGTKDYQDAENTKEMYLMHMAHGCDCKIHLSQNPCEQHTKSTAACSTIVELPGQTPTCFSFSV